MVEKYSTWEVNVQDKTLQEELLGMKQNGTTIHEHFYQDLAFGTGGLRGILGVGPNRMNIHVVARVTQGYSLYLKEKKEQPSVAIAYDSRINSLLFAQTALEVFTGNGIKVFIYPKLMPTPALSFAVRNLACDGGIVITASHNPSCYNGYKVYGADGCQITSKVAKEIAASMEKVDYFDNIHRMEQRQSFSEGLAMVIDNSTEEAYQKAISRSSILPKNADKNISIVYTPLHGAGISCVPDCLARNGFHNVILVEEQQKPDGTFPTCSSPNPEEKEALTAGIHLARMKKADLVLATDPDCDRVGVAVLDEHEYHLLNGNQIGVLLLDFICFMKTKQNTMPLNPIVVKTIVTTPMVKRVTEDYHVSLIDVLTGFKYIGEQIGILEKKQELERFLFGLEESHGYLSTTEVRDKDGVNSSLLLCEMTSFWKSQGKSLVQRLDYLYQKYGYYQEKQTSMLFEGSEGQRAMLEYMEEKRQPIVQLFGRKVITTTDFLTQISTNSEGLKEKVDLPKTNMLRWELEGNVTVMLRPSGTEPKIKIYYSVAEESREKSLEVLGKMNFS